MTIPSGWTAAPPLDTGISGPPSGLPGLGRSPVMAHSGYILKEDDFQQFCFVNSVISHIQLSTAQDRQPNQVLLPRPRALSCCSPPIGCSFYTHTSIGQLHNCTTAAAHSWDRVHKRNETGEATPSKRNPAFLFQNDIIGHHTVVSAHIVYQSTPSKPGRLAHSSRDPSDHAALQLNAVQHIYLYQSQCSPAPTTSAVAEAVATTKAVAATPASRSTFNPSVATAHPPYPPSTAENKPHTRH